MPEAGDRGASIRRREPVRDGPWGRPDSAVLRHGARRAGPGQPAQRQAGREQRRRGWQPQHGRCHSGQHHPDQAQSLAPRHHSAALGLIATQHGAPGLVRDGKQAVCGVGQDQRRSGPGHQSVDLAHRREEQTGKSQGQPRCGNHPGDEHAADRSCKQPVAQPSQQRINERVQQPGRQQQRTEQGQRDAKLAGVVVRQDHIQRQSHKSQRQTQAPVQQAVPIR
jgi:hypothetical protein